MIEFFSASKYKSLKTNKANVLACQVGVLSYHQKANLFQKITLFSLFVIGLIALFIVIWPTLNIMEFMIFFPIVIFCLYQIHQYFNALTNPDLNYVHIEGQVSLLTNPYRVKCQGQVFMTSKEIWLEINPGRSYRLWYSSVDWIKHLIAFEFLQSNPINEVPHSARKLMSSNSLGEYATITESLPYSPFDEKSYTPPSKELRPLPYLEAQSIQLNTDILIETLSSDNSTERLHTYRALLTLGGEAILPLKPIAMDTTTIQQPVALWLMDRIANDTNTRLSKNSSHLVCTLCFVHCHSHKVRLSWRKSIIYYGCRVCNQSRDFFNVHKVVAVLDTNMTNEYEQQHNVLWVNWLHRRTLFDFDEVKIIQATDEAVERFIVQVGNDTDRIRHSSRQDICCSIATSCKLSENAIRILEKTFGQLEEVNLSELLYQRNNLKTINIVIDNTNQKPNTLSSPKWLLGLGSLALALTWWVKRKI